MNYEISFFLLFLVIVAFAAIITKPTDQQCIELAKSNVNTAIYNSSSNSIVKGIESLLVDVGVNKVFFRIEDNIFYKTVYLKFDNSKVGTVLFGTFINSSDISPTSNNRSGTSSSNSQNDGGHEAQRETNIPGTANNRNSDRVNEKSYETNPLESAKAELYAAKDRMRKIKTFHLLRTNRERAEQIRQQEQYILSLETKISLLEGNNASSLSASAADTATATDFDGDKITLPHGFYCMKSEDYGSQNFSSGKYDIDIHTWGHDGISTDELVSTVSANFNGQIKFSPINYGMYWGTGKSEGKYYYIVLIPKDILQITLSANSNDAEFSTYSVWLLTQIRNEQKSGSEFYFIDEKGRSSIHG